MADEKIVTSIVANSDFSNLIADLQRVTSSLHNLQQEFAGGNRALAGQIAATNAMFAETMRKTGQYSTHFVSLTSDVEKFGKSLDGGRLKLGDYFRVYQDHVRTSGGLIRDLAKQQVQLQNAVLQPLGRNAQGLMQYNVHIPRGLDLTKNKTALLKQELQIMNKVIQDGGVQLINWGKNTQWAGRQLTVGLTLPLVAFGKAAADAFRVADQELTRLTKVYGDVAGTSAQELAKVRKDVAATAKELSSAMGVNFAETISLAADIAATGKTGNELLGSLKETTRLAVLGEVDRQEAMKATLAIQSAFKSNTDELAQSINFLNAVENQTSTTLNDLVEAIPKAGPVIKGLGGNVQDLALYLTAMREGGVNASEGANALKSALASLINPTDVAVKKFQGFGIDLLGIVQKNAGSTTDTLFALQAALDRLDPLSKQQAIEQLFGKFQFSRLNALFENLGRQGSQTLQVLDLMKASAGELEAVAGRELTAVTESAAGRFKRAMESLKADLAGIGDQFLNIATKLINVLDKILQFGQKLPDPIKKILAFGGAFTAIIGPVIMLTGVLANFFGYIIKGLGHFKALFKGAEGFKLLTPEIMAAQHASSLLGDEFYNDAKAAETLRLAIRKLSEDLILLQKNASGATAATAGLGQIVATPAGTPISVVGGTSLLRQADPTHPLIGGQGRAAAHLNPRDPNNPATMFGLTFQPEPLNRVIGRTPQILMTERLPGFEGLTEVGGRSTGVVAGEHARYAALMATLGLQSKAEIEELKKTIRFGGQVSSDFIATFDDILPITTSLSNNAAAQSAAIVAELRAGTITVEQAKARIIAINAQLELMMGEAVIAYGAGRGRTIDLTKTPLIDQPIVDVSGKPNVRGMFRQGIFRDVMTAVGRATRTRTYGGPYSIETTMPTLPPGYTMSPSGLIIPGRNKGGEIFYNNGDQVPGPNVNADVVPAMLTPGEFVIRRDIAQQDPDGMRALNEGRAIVVPFNANSGGMVPGVQYRNGGNWIVQAFAARSRMIGGLRTPNLRPGSTSGPSTIGAAEQGVGVSFGQIYKRTSKIYSDPTFMAYGISPTTKGEVLVHAMTPGYLRRTSGLEAAGSSVAIPSSQLKDFGITSTSRAPFLQALPSQFAKNTQKFNDALKSGALAADFRPVVGSDMISLLLFLKDQGVPPAQAIAIANEAAKNLNDRVLGHRGKITEALFGRFLNDASVKALLSAFRIKRNRGGKIPGYILGGITRKWGKVYGGDELSNTDPLHGPLQIGKFVSPKNTRTGRSGEKVFYTRPGSTSLTDAFLTGSLEDRGRYVTQEYMLGNYDVLRIPGAIEAMKAWGRKATGTFYRGINFRKFSAGPKPLPDWLEAEIKAAQASGDFSSLIGKEFIMRRSSWTSNPDIANEFGDFRIVADVKNRRVTPSSEMFPGIKFVPKSAQKKSKAKKLEAARSEEESIFGGKFRIVAADKDGIRVETVAGPMGGNRRFGGPVNAGTPYVVGENGPELFVPKTSGGIVSNYGYARGVQNRIAGGPILRLLAMLGLPFAGQAVGSRVGGTAGAAISTTSMMAPMFMMPGMMPGRSGASALSKLGLASDISRGPGQTMGQSIFAGTKYASSIGAMTTSTSKLASTFGKVLAGVTKFNLALTAGVTVLTLGYKAWRSYQDGLERTRLASGLTAESAGKLGLKYKSLTSELRASVETLKIWMATNKAIYEGMMSSNAPFKMTIAEYKKLRKEVKETMKDQIDLINNTKEADLGQLAVQLKAMFVAAGMSAEEASKKVYMAFSLSNKAASAATSTIGNQAFNDIKDSATAATAAIDTFNITMEKTRDGEARLNALNTAWMAISSAIDDATDKAEKNALKNKEYFDETQARLEEEKKKLDELSNIEIAPIGPELLQQLAVANPSILKFGNALDTVVSLMQKMTLMKDFGFTGDLSTYDTQATAALYAQAFEINRRVVEANKQNALKGEYAELSAMEKRQAALEKAARGEKVQTQINRRERIKSLQEEIDKINEAADARKKALQEEAEDQDINIEIQKKRLEYQQKLSMGDMGGAAQAQLDLQQLVNRQQRTLTERAIEEKRLSDIAPYQDKIDKLNEKSQDMADKAALASESLGKLNEDIKDQRDKIDEFNKSVTSYIVNQKNNTGDLNALGAAAIKAAEALGLTKDQIKEFLNPSASEPIKLRRSRTTIERPEAFNIDPNALGVNTENLPAAPTKKVPDPGNLVGEYNRAKRRGTSATDGTPYAKLVFNRTTGKWEIIRGTDNVRAIKPENYITYEQYQSGTKRYAFGGYLRAFSDGSTDGPIFGPGTGTSDSILARLSNGEFVTKASSVSDIGVNNMHLVNTMGSAGILKAAENIINGYKDGGEIKNYNKGGLASGPTRAALSLLGSMSALFPKRNRASDGIMPSAQHMLQNPVSDHNKGLAVDITHDPKSGVDGNKLFRSLRLDPRTSYLIFNRRIWNKSIDSAESSGRIYRGSNPHTSHIHVSILSSFANAGTAWLGAPHDMAMRNQSVPANRSKPEGVGEDAYVVKSGDSLSTIAKRAGVSLSKLLSANPKLANESKYMGGSRIFRGTEINVPKFAKGGLFGRPVPMRRPIGKPILDFINKILNFYADKPEIPFRGPGTGILPIMPGAGLNPFDLRMYKDGGPVQRAPSSFINILNQPTKGSVSKTLINNPISQKNLPIIADSKLFSTFPNDLYGPGLQNTDILSTGTYGSGGGNETTLTGAVKRVQDYVHGIVGLLNTYYGAKYKNLFNSLGVKNTKIMDADIVPLEGLNQLYEANPGSAWSGSSYGPDGIWGTEDDFESPSYSVMNPYAVLGSSYKWVPSEKGVKKGIFVPSKKNLKNLTTKKMAKFLSESVFQTERGRIAILNLVMHEFGHAFHNKFSDSYLKIIDKNKIKGEYLPYDVLDNFEPYIDTFKGNKEVFADKFAGAALAELYSKGFLGGMTQQYIKRLRFFASKQNEYDPEIYKGTGHPMNENFRHALFGLGMAGKTDTTSLMYEMLDIPKIESSRGLGPGFVPKNLLENSEYATKLIKDIISGSVTLPTDKIKKGEYSDIFSQKDAINIGSNQPSLVERLKVWFSKVTRSGTPVDGPKNSKNVDIKKNAMGGYIKGYPMGGLIPYFAAGGKIKGYAVGGLANRNSANQNQNSAYDEILDIYRKWGDLKVNFQTDKYDLLPEELIELKATADAINRIKDWPDGEPKEFIVQGQADQRASTEYNKTLSMRRAKLVAELLSSMSPEYNFIPKGIGEVSTEYTKEAMAQVRTASIVPPWIMEIIVKGCIKGLPKTSCMNLFGKTICGCGIPKETPEDIPDIPITPVPPGTPGAPGIPGTPGTPGTPVEEKRWAATEEDVNLVSGTSIQDVKADSLLEAYNQIAKGKRTKIGIGITSPSNTKRIFRWNGNLYAFDETNLRLYGYKNKIVYNALGKKIADGSTLQFISLPNSTAKDRGAWSWGADPVLTPLPTFNQGTGGILPLKTSLIDRLIQTSVLKQSGEVNLRKAILAAYGILPDNNSNYAYGGYINPSYFSNMSMPSYKTGIRYLPGDTIAKLHEGEAVLPKDINPWNPQNQGSGLGASYSITNNITAAPGMDVELIGEIVTRKTMAAIKQQEVINNYKMGPARVI